MSERILEWNVPVNDEEHLIGWGAVVHVACQSSPNVIQVWTLEKVEDDAMIEPKRTVQVFGTGHALPDPSEYLGTAVTPDGRFVWHILAVGEGTDLGPDTPEFYSTSETTPYGTVVAYIVPGDADEEHTVHDLSKITRGGVDHMIWMLSTGIEETA